MLVGMVAATVMIPVTVGVVSLLTGFAKQPALIFSVTAITVGTLVGTILGVSQWYVLRGIVPGVKARAWIVATTLGSLLPWTIIFASEIISGGSSAEAETQAPELPVSALLITAILYGALLGGILGTVQWIALRAHAEHASWWIVGTIGAGAIALPFTLFAVSWAQAQTSYWIFWIGRGRVKVHLLRPSRNAPLI
jgi:uncharacterized integral membrane protein